MPGAQQRPGTADLASGPFPEPSLTPKLMRSRSKSSGFIQGIPEDRHLDAMIVLPDRR